MSTARGPLAGIRVVDFGHTVLGPSCAMVLADLGAQVVKIEPSPGGDPTRALKGFGAGYFGYFNRNKASVALDLKQKEGLDLARRIVSEADVLVENFGPGTIERLGLGWEDVRRLNPRLIFASLKGFFAGPYGERMALDEIVQMMSGLAFMTGPSGRPLRAGTSVIDITGGLFAVIAILAALRECDRTGQGQRVGAALYETAVFLMGQHLCYAAQSDGPIPPMPERVSAWAVYEIFRTGGGGQLFVGITSDAHWTRFCQEAGLVDLLADAALATNNQRIAERPRLIPALTRFFAAIPQERAVAICEAARIPFAEVRRPEDLFADPHLVATHGLLPVTLPGGVRTTLPRLPIRMDGLGADATDPPALGQDTRAVLAGYGLSDEAIDDLARRGIVVAR